MRTILKPVFIFLLIANSSSLFSQNISNLEGEALIQSPTGTGNIGRGETIPQQAQALLLPNNSKIQIAFNESSWIEIHGPARIEIQNQKWDLSYGYFFIVGRNFSRTRLYTLAHRIRPRDRNGFWIVKSQQTPFASIYTHRSRPRVGRELTQKKSLYGLSLEHLEHTQYLLDEDFESLENEMLFSRPLFREQLQQESHQSFRNHLLFAQRAGTLHFKNSLSGYSLSSGLEFTHKRYFSMPRRPLRIHYLRNPAIRLGAGFDFSNKFLSIEDGFNGNIQSLTPYALAGLSWLGLSFDASWRFMKDEQSSYTYEWPFGFGLRLTYEWDLLSVTANSLTAQAGYRYSASKVQLSGETSNRYIEEHGLVLGISLLF